MSGGTYEIKRARPLTVDAFEPGPNDSLGNLLLSLLFFLFYLFLGLLFFRRLGGFFLGRFFCVLTFTHGLAPNFNKDLLLQI